MHENQEKIEKLYCLAQDRFHQDDLPQAINSLKAVLQLDFKHLDAHFLLAQIYQKDQSYELSSQHFRTCIKEDYKKNELYKLIAFNSKQLALYKNAIHELQKHLHNNPLDDDAYALMGDIYFSQQEYHFAKKVYLEAISMNQKNSSYYFKLSHVYKIKGDLRQALLEAQKALSLDLNYHEAYFLVATIYSNLKEYEKSIEYYKKAIAINNTIAIYHNNLASVLNQLQRKEEALESQKIALNLEPKNSQYQNNLNKL